MPMFHVRIVEKVTREVCVTIAAESEAMACAAVEASLRGGAILDRPARIAKRHVEVLSLRGVHEPDEDDQPDLEARGTLSDPVLLAR